MGVAACRMPAAAARTVSSRSGASVKSSVTSSTPAPGTLRTPRHTASTAPGSSGSSTTSSSMATPASRSSTSRPTTLPSTAPISAATAPRTPGASGSQIRMRVSTVLSRSDTHRRGCRDFPRVSGCQASVSPRFHGGEQPVTARVDRVRCGQRRRGQPASYRGCYPRRPSSWTSSRSARSSSVVTLMRSRGELVAGEALDHGPAALAVGGHGEAELEALGGAVLARAGHRDREAVARRRLRAQARPRCRWPPRRPRRPRTSPGRR